MPQELLAGRSSVRARAELIDSYRPPGGGIDFRLRVLLAERPFPGDGRFGCYLLADSSPYSDIARAVECSVFQRFFGNQPSDMAEAYAAYEGQSRFLLVVDRQQRQPAGALRIIGNAALGLKTLDDIQHEPLSIPTSKVLEYHGIDDLDACWDIGTLAVLKPYRGRATDHIVSTTLYGLVRSEAHRHGIEHLVAIMDDHAYTQLACTLGLPFVPIVGSPPFSYLGSQSSRAVYTRVRDALHVMQAYLDALDRDTRRTLGPYLERVLYGADLPPVVEVS